MLPNTHFNIVSENTKTSSKTSPRALKGGVIACAFTLVSLLLSASTGCGGAQSQMLPSVGSQTSVAASNSRAIPLEDDGITATPSPSPSPSPTPTTRAIPLEDDGIAPTPSPSATPAP